MTPEQVRRFLPASETAGTWTDEDGVCHEIRALDHHPPGCVHGGQNERQTYWHSATACARFGWYRLWFDSRWSPEYSFIEMGPSLLEFDDDDVVTCLGCLTAGVR